MGAVTIRWTALRESTGLSFVSTVTLGSSSGGSLTVSSTGTAPSLRFWASLVGVSALLGARVLFSLLPLAE